MLGHIDRQTAEAVLRRNENNVETSVAYILDASQNTLAGHVAEDLRLAEAFSVAYEEFIDRREVAIREVAEQIMSFDLH